MNSNNNNDELFADLFAYRFALLDLFPNNEREIIIKLKIKLFELGFLRNNINGLIRSFYNYYNILISDIEINNANVMIYTYFDNRNINNYINNLNNYINNNSNAQNTQIRASNDINDNNDINTQINNRYHSDYIVNMNNNNFRAQGLLYSTIMNILNTIDVNEEEEHENNVETLTEEEFEELEVIRIDETQISEELECSICIDKFQLSEDAIKLRCNHLFHKNCIRSHVLNYNDKCPLCRGDIRQ